MRWSFALLLAACAPKIGVDTPRAVPEPLAAQPFTLPPVASGTLPHGVPLRVVTNAEVPLWQVTLAFDVGAFADPIGKRGTAAAAAEMLLEGVGPYDAAGFARAMQLLGGSISSGVSDDGATITVSGPRRNLQPILDLLVAALTTPTFPADAWTRMQGRRIANLQAALENPTFIAARVADRLTWGDRYAGHLTTEAAYRAITVDDLKAFHRDFLTPDHAAVFAAGDIDVPTLTAALAGLEAWAPSGRPRPDPVATPEPPRPTAIHLVDKPGAAQSVIQAIQPVLTPSDPDYWPLYMGNTVLGGAFTARVNMNLREDKGYTYGARCRVADSLGPAIWSCDASVNTPVTAPALSELRREVEDIITTRPITGDELSFFRSYRTRALAGSYETPGALASTLAGMWIQRLPDDWLQRYVPSVEAVDAATATQALQRWIRADRMTYLVVGDKAKVGPELAALGLPVIELDRDGRPLQPSGENR